MLRWLRCLLTLLLLCAAGAGHAAAASPAGTQTINQATLALGACAEGQDGRAVTLPDDWRQLKISPPAEACYRARLQLDRAPKEPWALRIDRLPGNHRVTVNGVPLGTRHMEGDQITSMGTLPYLIEVPANVLLPGENDIQIDVRMNNFRKPGVSPIVAGPLDAMRDDFDR